MTYCIYLRITNRYLPPKVKTQEKIVLTVDNPSLKRFYKFYFLSGVGKSILLAWIIESIFVNFQKPN